MGFGINVHNRSAKINMISGIVEYSPKILRNGKTLSTMATRGKTSTFVYDANDNLELLRDKVIERVKDGDNTVITVTKKYFYNAKDALVEKITTTRIYGALENLIKETSEKVLY